MNESRFILIVDDDVEMLRALRFALEREGYVVTAHATAHSALQLLQTPTARFDLVITDVSMPGMTGLSFLTAVKTAFPSLPVIVITAFGDWGQYARALREGAFEFLSKPIEKAELLACVRRALQTTPSGASGAEAPG